MHLEGPIPSWQPLLAAIIWFIISMNILFPVCIIAQSAPSPYDTTQSTTTTTQTPNLFSQSNSNKSNLGCLSLSLFFFMSWISLFFSFFSFGFGWVAFRNFAIQKNQNKKKNKYKTQKNNKQRYAKTMDER